jgi:hypothetical protein
MSSLVQCSGRPRAGFPPWPARGGDGGALPTPHSLHPTPYTLLPSPYTLPLSPKPSPDLPGGRADAQADRRHLDAAGVVLHRAISSSRAPGPNPTPYTLHPTPYTTLPKPRSLHPPPYPLPPTPSTLHPSPCTLHHTPSTHHPPPYALTPTRSPDRRLDAAASGAVLLREISSPRSPGTLNPTRSLHHKLYTLDPYTPNP